MDVMRPAGGAAVMATGIVSIGLRLDHQPTLSHILLAIAAAFWLAVAASLLLRAARDRERWRGERRMPDLLAAVAGTSVLGAGLTLLGQDSAGYLFLAVGLCLWIGFLPPVLRHWSTPTVGASFLVTVSTESLAVVAALLAAASHLGWLAACALAPAALGLAAYVYALVRVDLGQLRSGRGDHWIFGGALAIATFACAHVTAALQVTGVLAGSRSALDDVTLALWAAAALWLPALLAGELLSPRLRYDTRRWSTVFPVGMYAAATIATGNLTGIGGLADAGRICVWIAFALWTITFTGLLTGRSARPPL